MQAVARRIDHERLLARLQPVEQVLDVGHARIDKDDPLGTVLHHAGAPWMLKSRDGGGAIGTSAVAQER
jgi:biotin carboxylase